MASKSTITGLRLAVRNDREDVTRRCSFWSISINVRTKNPVRTLRADALSFPANAGPAMSLNHPFLQEAWRSDCVCEPAASVVASIGDFALIMWP